MIGFLVMGIGGARTTGLMAVLVSYGIGLLIVVYVIYLLVSPKAAVVFSPEYQEVTKATPHIKYRTSCLLKGLLYLLLAFFLLGIVSFFITRR